ncbi:MAG: DUF4160 domain-containing protein [Deltaproteobacteria bacterium]|nr:DUF4160 domain-containing protein [Deltaproteobacteria bacterium]
MSSTSNRSANAPLRRVSSATKTDLIGAGGADERQEPPHVHVDNGEGECKFWLGPVALAAARRVDGHEIRAMEREVHANEQHPTGCVA